MKILLLVLFGLSVTSLTSCGGGGGGNTSANADISAPTATITFPPSQSLTEGNSITVRGTANDAEGSEISLVRVNGIDAISDDNFATWSAVIPLQDGVNVLNVETADIALNGNTEATTATIFSGTNTPSPGNLHDSPVGITIDRENNRLLVVNNAPSNGAIVAIDIDSGTQTLLSDNNTPDANNPFDFPQRIVVDEENNRALVTNPDSNAIIAVDLSSGIRTVLSDNNTPNTLNTFDAVVGITIDRDNNRALVINSGVTNPAVIAVDLTSGARSILSSNTLPNSDTPFDALANITLDTGNNRAIVSDTILVGLISVDLSSGERTIFSNNSIPNATNPFAVPFDISLDVTNNRVLVADNIFDLINGVSTTIGVDLDSGARTTLSSSTVPNNENIISNGVGIVVDSLTNTAYITDFSSGTVVATDTISGQRVIFSR